jgi:hypothetical protein
MRSAPIADYLIRVLARLESAVSDVGRQISRPLRCREPDPRTNTTLQLACGKPRLATAQLFHATRHLAGSYLSRLQFFLNHRCFMRSQRAERSSKSPRRLMTARAGSPCWASDPFSPGKRDLGRLAASRITRSSNRNPALTGRLFPRAVSPRNGGFWTRPTSLHDRGGSHTLASMLLPTVIGLDGRLYGHRTQLN